MTRLWIDTNAVKNQLATFFADNKSDLSEFGNTVNQTFEAFVFASLVKWYTNNGWTIEFKHPKRDQSTARLKFSTRGRPNNYTYAICTNTNQRVQIRHQIRVATKHHRSDQTPPANVVLDVAVISDQDLSNYSSYDYAENITLITFGEAKHMSAFAELIASFIGLVHELKPEALEPIRSYNCLPPDSDHPAPFLYVSGYLYHTAKGLVETIRQRGYDIDVYDHDSGAIFGVKLPVMPGHLGVSS